MFDEVTGETLANRVYRITGDGRTVEGRTDADGLTQRVTADSAVTAKIEVFPEGFGGTGGWHHFLGEAMIISGIVGMLIAGIGALRRDHGQR